MPNIRINDMRLLNVIFAVNEQFTEPADGIEFRFTFDLESQYEEADNLLIVKVRVSTYEEMEASYPFTFNIMIVGLFNVDTTIDKTLVDQLSKINCPAILFSYLRETVSDLTRRAGFPPLYLPVVNFVKEAGKKQRARQIENKAEMSKTKTSRSRRSSKAKNSQL